MKNTPHSETQSEHGARQTRRAPARPIRKIKRRQRKITDKKSTRACKLDEPTLQLPCQVGCLVEGTLSCEDTDSSTPTSISNVTEWDSQFQVNSLETFQSFTALEERFDSALHQSSLMADEFLYLDDFNTVDETCWHDSEVLNTLSLHSNINFLHFCYVI